MFGWGCAQGLKIPLHVHVICCLLLAGLFSHYKLPYLTPLLTPYSLLPLKKKKKLLCFPSVLASSYNLTDY